MVEFISFENNFLSFTINNKTTFKRLTSLNNYILNIYSKNNKTFITNLIKQENGDWGLGIGDWGLGIGPNPQSPIPNPLA